MQFGWQKEKIPAECLLGWSGWANVNVTGNDWNQRWAVGLLDLAGSL